ncbi:MAG: metal ABC transporter permease [Pseudomonadota bacterium]
MIDTLLEPLNYAYMLKAIGICALVGAVCAFLSCFLILKGWSLMGDALAHAIVPGVALAYLLALPYAVGAFFAGLLAALSMTLVRQRTALREDAVIGLVFTSFFAVGLLLASINPMAVNVQSIILGNILAISDADTVQVIVISIICLGVLGLKWKDLTASFFDENHARTIGLPVRGLSILFFTLLSAAAVTALQTVGACLVIAMIVTPGATAYLLTDRFGRLIWLSVAIGAGSSAVGAYASYFLDANPGGLIVCLQTVLFLIAVIVAPKHGLISSRARQRRESEA